MKTLQNMSSGEQQGEQQEQEEYNSKNNSMYRSRYEDNYWCDNHKWIPKSHTRVIKKYYNSDKCEIKLKRPKTVCIRCGDKVRTRSQYTSQRIRAVKGSVGEY